MSPPTLRQLQAVAAICREGRIVAAARRLGLTPPAVTQQLRQAEEETGVALFERTSGGMRPTAAGLAFAEAAEEVLARLDRLGAELDEIRGAKRGRLAIGIVSSTEHFIPRLAESFAAAHPEVEVSLHPGGRKETMARLAGYDLDFVLSSRPPRDVPVRAEAFAEFRFVIVAAPDHPLAGARAIPRATILAEHFVAREPGSSPRTALDRFLGPERDRQTLTEIPGNDAIRAAVMADLGIAFMALHTVAADIAAGRLALLDVQGTPVRRQWFSIRRSDRTLTPVMEDFLTFLKAEGPRFLLPQEPAEA